MLLLIAAWTLLAVVAMGLGAAFVRAHAVPGKPLEWWLLAFGAAWFGLCLAGWVFFVIALFVPLAGATLVITWTVLAAAALIVGSRSARPWLRTGAIAGPSALSLAAFFLLALALAERSTWIGNLEDTGAYHWNIVQWLNSLGVVPGMGLFQLRLATSSSWLALTAALNAGFAEERVLTIANGLLFLISIGLFAVASLRIARGMRTQSDWFAAAGLLLLVPTLLRWEMRLSPSPDVPTLIAPVIFAWYMMRIEEAPDKREGLDPWLGLLVFSALAVTIKLNAVPLLVVAALAYLANGRPRTLAARALVAALTGGAVLAPLAAASLLTTGCLLFPSPLGCFEWDLGVGARTAREYTRIVRETAPWDITGWLFACALAAAALWPAGRRLTPAARLTVVLVLTALLYLIAFAPTSRFGRGYLVLAPALAFAAHRDRIAQLATRAARLAPRAWAAAGALVLLAIFAVHLYKGIGHGRDSRIDPSINAPNPDWLAWPARLQYRGGFSAGETAHFRYAVSEQQTCWNHPLPCASNLGWPAMSEFRLRDPVRGLRAGFVRR